MKLANHIASAIGSTIDIWAVIINREGIIAIKFISKIEKKSGIKKLLFRFLFVRMKNSFDRIFFIFKNKIFIFDEFIIIGENKIIRGIIQPK
jgi:hypothetical protein